MIPQILSIRRCDEAAPVITEWHAHPRPQMQIGCVLAGREEVRLPQTVQEMTPGGFYAIGSGHLHKITMAAHTSEYHAFVELTDAPRRFRPEASAMDALDWFGGHSFFVKASPAVSALMGEVEMAWNSSRPEGPFLAECALLRLFSLVRDSDPILVRGSDTRTAPLTCNAREYHHFHNAAAAISQRYAERTLTPDHVAEICHISRSFLDKIFRATVKQGPWQYILRYRLDRARELIHRNQYTFSQIADMTGFGDPFAFSRAFKRAHGVSPRAYVKRVLRYRLSRTPPDRRRLPDAPSDPLRGTDK